MIYLRDIYEYNLQWEQCSIEDNKNVSFYVKKYEILEFPLILSINSNLSNFNFITLWLLRVHGPMHLNMDMQIQRPLPLWSQIANQKLRFFEKNNEKKKMK